MSPQERHGEELLMAKKPTYEELEQRIKELEDEAERHKVQLRSLEETQGRYRDLIEGAHDLIQSVRPDGSFAFVNRAWLEALGYCEEELPSLNLFDVIHPDSLQHCQEIFSEIMAGQRVADIEAIFVAKSGNAVYVEGTASPRLIEGKVLATHAIFRDISEPRLAQKALRESEERFRAIFEQAAVGVCLVETETGRFLRVNQKYCDIVGCNQEEMSRMTLMEITHPDDLEASLDNIERLKSGEIRGYTFEKRYIRKDGSIVWVNLTISPMWDVDEEPNFHMAVVEDITDRKLAREALRESEEKYRTLFEAVTQSGLGILIHQDMDGVEAASVFANDAAVHITGYTKEELAKLSFFNVIHPAYRDAARRRYIRRLSGEIVPGIFEIAIISKGGSDIRIELSSVGTNFQNGAAVVTLFRDITDRKQIEEALRESEEKYRNILEKMEEGYYEVDLAGDLTFFNDAMCRIGGYARDELMGMNNREYMDPETAKKVYNAYNEVYRTGRPAKNCEYEAIRKDGTRGHVEISASLLKDSEGKPIGFRGIARDVTERKQAERELQESEKRLRLVLDATNDGVWDLNVQTGEVYFSPRWYTMLDYEPYEIPESYETWASLLHPDDKEYAEGVIRRNLEGLTTGFEMEFRLKTKLGGWRWILGRGKVAEFDKEGQPLRTIGTHVDITSHKEAEEERARLETQLQQARKMEAIGLLAGGVAHDLNNILSGIVGYPDLLLLDLPKDSPIRRPIEVIKESGQRAADVVSDLLTVARGVASSREVSNLNSLVQEYLGSPEHKRLESVRSSIAFETVLEPELLNISCSPVHIKKSLMNLVTNASEAIEGTGRVTISTTNRYLDEPLKGYEDIRTGEYAVLSVSDDGSGISPEDLERVFEPFYTKKVMGRRGTGLGLAVVWNTVQDHNGYINVTSSKKGTTFDLYFPITREEAAAVKQEIPIEDYLGHGEKILVVDDEGRQREIACGLLSKLGYNAEAVSSGEEAIEYLKEHPVDLIVLDMIMPKGINGRQTYEEIIKIRPDQKAIIASGFSETEDVKIAQSLGAGKYIKKPYTLEKIGLAVKEELAK